MHEATALVMALELPFEPLEPPANKCCQVLASLDVTPDEVRFRVRAFFLQIFYGSVKFHAVIRQQLEIEGITQSSYNSNRAKTPRALCDKSTESCINRC